MKSCTVCVLSWNGLPYNKILYNTLAKFTPKDIKILWGDNNSTDGTLEYLHSIDDDRLTILEFDKNYGVGGGRNRIIEYVDTDAFCMIDNDMQITQYGWINKLVDVLYHKKNIGAVAPTINLLANDATSKSFTEIPNDKFTRNKIYKDRKGRHKVFTHDEDVSENIAYYLSILKKTSYQTTILNCEGGGTTMKKEVWDKVGGYPDWGLAYHEGAFLKDSIMDLGLEFWVVPSVFIWHYAHATLNAEDHPSDLNKIFRAASDRKLEWRASKNMISLNIAVWDEYGVAERCIASARKYVDEIVIMHHSANRLPKYIAEKADVLIERNLEGFVIEKFRNELIDASKNEWILMMDPDEFIGPELGKRLHNYCAIGNMTGVDGWYLNRFNIVYDKEYNLTAGNDFPDYNLRLFRRKARYSGTIYEDSLRDSTISQPLGLDKVSIAKNGIHYHDKAYENKEEVERTNDLYKVWEEKDNIHK